MKYPEYLQLIAVVIQTLVFILGGSAIVVRNSAANKDLHEDVKAMQEELKDLARVITAQAVQDVRLNEQSRRMTLLETRVEDMRRGKGYVKERDVLSVDREY